MASSDSSPTTNESQSPISQNPVEEIPNPQNSNQEIPSPQNPEEVIPNPQNPDEEITNPKNPDQEIPNTQNPDKENTSPEVLFSPTPQEMELHEAHIRRQHEVEEALRQVIGEEVDEWVEAYKKKVRESDVGAMYEDDVEKVDKKEDCILFDDDWKFEKDCKLFKGSRFGEDDVMTLSCFADYVRRGLRYQQKLSDWDFLYGFVSSFGWECAGLEVLKKKLSKLLCNYLMLVENLRLYTGLVWWPFNGILLELGTQVWGSIVLEGTFPLLDMPGIGIRNQEHASIAEMRASARRSRRGRRFRISQDEAFDSRPAVNQKRGLVIRKAATPADDRAPEADEKAKGNLQTEKEAPNKRPCKFLRVEQLLFLFPESKDEDEDDFMLLRHASAYGRNVTFPTVTGLYVFILANLPTGKGISWFRLKLKLIMLEKRYLSILGVLDSNGDMEACNTVYNRELYRMGRQFWGDEIADQNPDGNLGTRGGASGSGGVNEGAGVCG